MFEILNRESAAVRSDVAACLRVQTYATVWIGRYRHRINRIQPIEQDEERLIEDVENIRLQFDPYAFVNLESLGERQVESIIRIALPAIANQIPIHELKIYGIAREGINGAERARSTRGKKRRLRAVTRGAAVWTYKQVRTGSAISYVGSNQRPVG